MILDVIFTLWVLGIIGGIGILVLIIVIDYFVSKYLS